METKKSIKFTPREIDIISGIEIGGIIRDKRILKKLESIGYVTLHSHTGCFVNCLGGSVKAWYVDECTSFSAVGHKFRGVYVSGCFCPYVTRIS